MSDMECPYCQADQEAEKSELRDGELHEHECTECKKAFVFWANISWDFQPEAAPCLNGADHDFSDWKFSGFSGSGRTERIEARRCVCGERQVRKEAK